jgi:hypothetical protein
MRWRHVTAILVLLGCCGVAVALGGWLRRPAAERVGPAQAALERVVPVARFRQAPLERVLRECERFAGVPIAVDWAAVGEAGVTRETRVSLFRYGDTLGEVLERIASQLPDTRHLACSFEEEWDRVTLGVSGFDRGRMALRVYDVRRILEHESWLDHMTDAPNVGMRAGGIVGTPAPAPPPDARVRRGEKLVQLLTETVDPDSWSFNGGTLGQMDARGDVLVVVQRVANHRALGRVLAQLDFEEPIHFDWPGPWEVDQARDALLARRAAGDVRLERVSFNQAADHLRETFRVNIEGDGWLAALMAVDPSEPVTLRLVRPTLEEAARELARHVAPEPDEPAVVASGRDEVILTSASAAARRTETLVYDFRPLLAGGRSDPAAFDELVNRMTAEVAPRSWRDRGGYDGAARQAYDRAAVITQTRANHRRVRAWLDARLAELQGRDGGT